MSRNSRRVRRPRLWRLATVGDHTIIPAALPDRPTVIDLGFNRGDFARQMVKSFGACVAAAEPDWRYLAHDPQRPEIRTRGIAVSDKNGEASFALAGGSDGRLIEGQHDGQVLDTVETITLDAFLDWSGFASVDVLKMDIEGAEVGVLLSTPAETLLRCGQITVEFHDWIGFSSEDEVEAVIQRLHGLGFRSLCLSYHTRGDVLFVNPSLHVSWPTRLAWQAQRYLDGSRRMLKRTYSRRRC